MNRFFVIFFFIAFTAALASVVSATEQDDVRVVDGVRVMRVATTSNNYVYWSFENKNDYPITVIYTVADYPAGTLVLGSGEQKRSYSAYYAEHECNVVVRRISAMEAERQRGKE